jgi:hypothetical protein
MSPSLIQPCELCCGSGCDCIACVCITSLCAPGPQTFVCIAGVRTFAIGVDRVAPSNWFPEVPSCEPLCTLVPWSYVVSGSAGSHVISLSPKNVFYQTY